MAATKINLMKIIACTINANAVRGCSYEKFFTYHIKVSVHENFQIYGVMYKLHVCIVNIMIIIIISHLHHTHDTHDMVNTVTRTIQTISK